MNLKVTENVEENLNRFSDYRKNEIYLNLKGMWCYKLFVKYSTIYINLITEKMTTTQKGCKKI